MGIALSLPGKLGLPTLDSLPIDQLYNNYFSTVETEEAFICAVVNLCSDFNTIMPGKHSVIDIDVVKAYYNDTWAKEVSENKKSALIQFMKNNIEEYKPSSFAMICTGCVAPFGAVALKKTGEKVPQLKRFRIDLVPNFVVVPTVTLISLVGVRIFNLKNAVKKKQ